MKKTFIVILLFVFAAGITANNNQATTQTNQTTAQVNIPLIGNAPKSQQQPITLFQGNNYLEASFNNIGKVYIVIQNEKGSIIYQNSIDTSAGNKLIIPTYNYYKGEYTISFSYRAGDLFGVFYVK